MSYLPLKILEHRLLQFLKEDIEYGDITSDLIPNIPIEASLIAKQEGVLCGIIFAEILLESLGVEIINSSKDGKLIKNGEVVLLIRGMSRDILISERTILNLVMRLSGIATKTKWYVDKVKKQNMSIKIASTRKTTPGFRYFEKYAIKIGGGDPHRWSLSDTVLIKENHLQLFNKESIETILLKSKNETSFTKKIDIEVENILELKRSLSLSPDIIMLDDFSTENINKAIQIINQKALKKQPLIEISGGINEHNFEQFLIPGVDIISIGALTHSVQSIDFSLKIDENCQ